MPAPRLDELSSLVQLFFSKLSDLGDFVEVDAASLPETTARLLAQNHHMTSALEAFQKSPMQVEVLNWANHENLYWRKILLQTTRDARPVQFGIIRMNFGLLSPAVQHRIEQRTAPVGRILLENNVICTVEVHALWRIVPSEELRRQLQMPTTGTVYGRTASIHCDGKPAIELLEILAPV